MSGTHYHQHNPSCPDPCPYTHLPNPWHSQYPGTHHQHTSSCPNPCPATHHNPWVRTWRSHQLHASLPADIANNNCGCGYANVHEPLHVHRMNIISANTVSGNGHGGGGFTFKTARQKQEEEDMARLRAFTKADRRVDDEAHARFVKGTDFPEPRTTYPVMSTQFVRMRRRSSAKYALGFRKPVVEDLTKKPEDPYLPTEFRPSERYRDEEEERQFLEDLDVHIRAMKAQKARAQELISARNPPAPTLWDLWIIVYSVWLVWFLYAWAHTLIFQGFTLGNMNFVTFWGVWYALRYAQDGLDSARRVFMGDWKHKPLPLAIAYRAMDGVDVVVRWWASFVTSASYLCGSWVRDRIECPLRPAWDSMFVMKWRLTFWRIVRDVRFWIVLATIWVVFNWTEFDDSVEPKPIVMRMTGLGDRVGFVSIG